MHDVQGDLVFTGSVSRLVALDEAEALHVMAHKIDELVSPFDPVVVVCRAWKSHSTAATYYGIAKCRTYHVPDAPTKHGQQKQMLTQFLIEEHATRPKPNKLLQTNHLPTAACHELCMTVMVPGDVSSLLL